MNLAVDYVRVGELTEAKVIPVDFRLYSSDKTLYHTTVDVGDHGTVSFDVIMPRSEVLFDVSCHDLDIFHCPVQITCIHFDNFYHLKTFTHHALPIPTKENVYQVDLVPGNCLFFCGTLQYKWQGPTPQILMTSKFCWDDTK